MEIETKNELEIFRDSFESRKDIIKLRKREREAMRNFDMVTMMRVRQEIEDKFVEEATAIKETRTSFYGAVEGMDDDKKKKLLACLHAMLYVSDVFVGVMMDMNDTLQEYDKSMTLDAFGNLSKLFRECEKEIKFLLTGCTMEYQIGFATRTDELREMVMDFAMKSIEEGNERFKEEAEMAGGEVIHG